MGIFLLCGIWFVCGQFFYMMVWDMGDESRKDRLLMRCCGSAAICISAVFTAFITYRVRRKGKTHLLKSYPPGS
jgi:hypothetical protein